MKQPDEPNQGSAPPPAASALTPAHVVRLRRDLARKGMEVNGRLTRLLAGMNARLSDLKMPHEQKPGLRPEEKLRRYLDQIIRAQRRLGTDGWAVCVTCGDALSQPQLDDAPWKEECDACLDNQARAF